MLAGCATDHASRATDTLEDASAAAETVAPAPDKGPAHLGLLPAPGEQAWRYLDGDDAWRYVAPEEHGELFDATYFDGRFFVLHGTSMNSEKLVISEINWLSSTRDGLQWDTITLTETPYQSYTHLASNGQSLLLAGSSGIGRLVGEEVEKIEALNQSWVPAVILPYPDGYAIGRMHDILWMGLDGSLAVVLEQPSVQFRAGVARESGSRSILTGLFGTFASTDGKHWTPENAPCTRCDAVGIAYGNGRYLAGDSDTSYLSDDGGSWTSSIWRPAAPNPSDMKLGAGEDRLSAVDFTGGHFVAREGSNTRLSQDGSSWSDQLKVSLDQIGPADCSGRCFVANGRILRAPAVLP